MMGAEKAAALNDTAAQLKQHHRPDAVLILCRCDDGSIVLVGSGANHHKANEMLSVGIHINLSQHDKLVIAGDAGQDAQQTAQEIERMSHENPG